MYVNEIGVFLGSMIGEVREVDVKTPKAGNERFLRVRVVLAVNKPLKRSLRVDLTGDGVITTLLLRYERLLDYCFKCIRLGHLLGDCPEGGDNKAVTTKGNLRLCVWMRTNSPPKRFNYGRGQPGQREWGRNKNNADRDNWRNTDDRWRKASQTSVGRKNLDIREENRVENKACMGVEVELNEPPRRDVHGEKSEGVL